MAYKLVLIFAISLSVIYALLNSCYSADVANVLKDSSNAVVEEFEFLGEKISDGVKSASHDVANEFAVLEEKISDGVKSASLDVANEFAVLEEKISDGVKSASHDVANEFAVLEVGASNALKYAEDVFKHELQLIRAKGSGCDCEDYSCGCCAHLEFPQIHLNDTGCVNLTYLVKDYGISFTMTIDDFTIVNETISARNPPPICFNVPGLEKYADLCLDFYDLDASKTKLHGCVDVEARLRYVLVGRFKIGCFNIGKSSLWKKYHLLLIEKIRSEQKKLNDNLLS